MAEQTVPLTIPEALALLAAQKQAHPDDFKPGASEEQIAQANANLSIPIPTAWQRVLSIANGFSDTNDIGFAFYGTNSVAVTDTDSRYMLSNLSPPHLVIAEDYTGDALTLDVSQMTEIGDCPVVWISHESRSEDSRWSNVAECLEYMLGEDNETV